MPRNALGRGLSALIPTPETLPQVEQSDQQHEPQPLAQPGMPGSAPPTMPGMGMTAGIAAAPALAPQSEGYVHVDIDLIDPSPYQPRTRFREEALEELSRSIQASGIVQPLVVRKIGARYQLIAGERRWRAAQRAQLQSVPTVVRNVPEELALEMTLVENIQREDLNPIEQARAFQRLTDEFHLTQEQVAERTGKDRATIANAMRLLRLETAILELLEDGRITPGHGRALLAVEDSEERIGLARRIVKNGMSVRQVERMVARGPKTPAKPAVEVAEPNAKAA